MSASLGRLAQLVVGVASRSGAAQQVLPAASVAASSWLRGASSASSSSSIAAVAQSAFAQSSSAFHSSAHSWQSTAPAAVDGEAIAPKVGDDNSHLVDKDIWDEAWAYDPRFGTEDAPIMVPSVLTERIIGVTDPEDDTLVIWGVLRQGDPPKQLVAGGEFFVLKKVDRVEKVGDVLGIQLVATD